MQRLTLTVKCSDLIPLLRAEAFSLINSLVKASVNLEKPKKRPNQVILAEQADDKNPKEEKEEISRVTLTLTQVFIQVILLKNHIGSEI